MSSNERGERHDWEILNDDVEEPTDRGEMRMTNGDFHFMDRLGVFNPRNAGARDNGYLIFKTDGGMVFTTAGDVIEKVTA